MGTVLTVLTVSDAKRKANYVSIVDNHILSFIEAGRALVALREEQLWVDEAGSFKEFLKLHWPQHVSHAYRQISACEVVADVEGLQSPIGDWEIEPPKNEAIAREVGKVEGQEARANVWVAAVESAKDNSPTATHVANVRKELYPPKDISKPKETTSAKHLKGLCATIDTVRKRIVELREEHAVGDERWKTAMKMLDESRIALAELARV